MYDFMRKVIRIATYRNNFSGIFCFSGQKKNSSKIGSYLRKE